MSEPDKQQIPESSAGEDLQHFAYIAAHELQEPLRAISGFIELLAKNAGAKLTDEESEWLQETAAGAERMSSLIQALLTFSKTESGHIEFERVALADIIDSAITDLQSVIIEKNAIINKPASAQAVVGDKILLSLLMRNLLSNSLKYCQKEACIEIEVVENGDCVSVEVSDNGIGFDMEDVDKLFKPFGRLHCKATYAGTGLGLALCKRIVERHDGKIWVKQSSEDGSVFCFSLPKKQPRRPLLIC